MVYVTILNEAIAGSKLRIELSEQRIPVNEAAGTVAEILGLYFLEIANEGLFVAGVSARASERAVELVREHPHRRTGSRGRGSV